MRALEEDVTAQHTALADARTELAGALNALSTCTRTEAKAAASKTGSPAMDAVYGAVNRVVRAESAYDIAAYDLHTAAGGDG